MNFVKNITQQENRTFIETQDHLGGFDHDYNNLFLEQICRDYLGPKTLVAEYLFDSKIKNKYPTIDFAYSLLTDKRLFNQLQTYKQHPIRNFSRFICCFNGSDHVARKLLVAILYRMGWFDTETCSKNFAFDMPTFDGHLMDFVTGRDRFYRKFFLCDTSNSFFQQIHSFAYDRFIHETNICTLEKPLCQSFLHVVSETMATSYYPFVTEKFLYSVVTRGLFLSYAQPGWHDHVEQYYGFRKYDKIFDYRFDGIQNPVERLMTLMSMISKFAVLSPDDWRDLHEMEADTIEYNYDHYFSGNYIKQLESLC